MNIVIKRTFWIFLGLVVGRAVWYIVLGTGADQRAAMNREGRLVDAEMNQKQEVSEFRVPMKYPTRGLTMKGNMFLLDGVPFRILSGSFHYFRVPPEYWKDRLLKMKAGGLNTVTTYIPWNLHEKVKGYINFGGNFDLGKFVETAKEVGLWVIIRPGPYICAEWEFGGLPAWLLHDPKMRVRTSSYKPYLDAVEAYFSKLMPYLGRWLHKTNQGPIIAFQVENEYGSINRYDPNYLRFVAEQIIRYGNEELLITSDGAKFLENGTLPGIVPTINFVKKPKENIEKFRIFWPEGPIMVTEFWSGWFDHWREEHHHYGTEELENKTRFILESGASINFYMYVGGTNWGFWNGANAMTGKESDERYNPTITSYDYDAPISEAGDVKPKWHVLKKLLQDLKLAPLDLPAPPSAIERKPYGTVSMTKVMQYEEIIEVLGSCNCITTHTGPVAMEMLDINNKGGQGSGWLIYRGYFAKAAKLKILGSLRDRAQVILNGKEIAKIERFLESSAEIGFDPTTLKENNTLDIIVENLGHVNYKCNWHCDTDRKGISGSILLDDKPLQTITHIPFQFQRQMRTDILESKLWKDFSASSAPAAFWGVLKLSEPPKDTFLLMDNWTKGIAIVNGNNMGRYWSVGPQRTLYIPAPILKQGDNDIVIFELHKPHTQVEFVGEALLGE